MARALTACGPRAAIKAQIGWRLTISRGTLQGSFALMADALANNAGRDMDLEIDQDGRGDPCPMIDIPAHLARTGPAFFGLPPCGMRRRTADSLTTVQYNCLVDCW